MVQAAQKLAADLVDANNILQNDVQDAQKSQRQALAQARDLAEQLADMEDAGNKALVSLCVQRALRRVADSEVERLLKLQESSDGARRVQDDAAVASEAARSRTIKEMSDKLQGASSEVSDLLEKLTSLQVLLICNNCSGSCQWTSFQTWSNL
jgi:hypothetical protein